MGLLSFGLVGLGLALVGDPDETVTYVYDAQGRLVEVQHAGDVNDGVETTYALDDADNRTNKTTDVPPALLAAPQAAPQIAVFDPAPEEAPPEEVPPVEEAS